MEIEHARTIPGSPEQVFSLVDDLGAYPSWMELVHGVTVAEPAGIQPAWDVELRAQVGPFARSKRLRMVRVVHEPHHRVVFERIEVDGRRHSPWILRASLRELGRDEVELVMTLEYGGALWTGAVLQRVLDDHVERGTAALRALVGR